MPGRYQLSKGTLKLIMAGEQIAEPIMQILEHKRIQINSLNKNRYRVSLSDGENKFSFVMLTVDTTPDNIQNYSIIKLQRYITSTVNNPTHGQLRVLLILEMEVIVNGQQVGEGIGTPVILTNDMIKNLMPTTSNSNQNEEFNNTVNNNTIHTEPNDSNSLNQSLSYRKIITPICALTPYHNKWVIKVRVTSKSDVRNFSNSRGEGKLFTMNLIDQSGEIKCTAFRELVDKYFDFIEVGRIYFMSKCRLQNVLKQYCTLKNDYEMVINNDSIIEECSEDDANIPHEKFNFVPIDQIATMEYETFVDVIGVCKVASDVQTFTSRLTNCELKKRNVVLIDQSQNIITLTLWGIEAETFDGSTNPVVAVKGGKIREFGGDKIISTIMSTQVKINPNIPEAYQIKGWFDLKGKTVDVRNISNRTNITNLQTSWISLKEVRDRRLGYSENGDYYQIFATILMARSENSVYKSCLDPGCNKKVTPLENGRYQCEKCNRDYPNFKYRLVLGMNIGDWTSNQWVSAFAPEAEKILGKSSQEVGEAFENDPEFATEVFQNASFKKFVFKCRTKMEMFNDEQRQKTVVLNVDPVDYETHNSYLVNRIKEFLF